MGGTISPKKTTREPFGAGSDLSLGESRRAFSFEYVTAVGFLCYLFLAINSVNQFCYSLVKNNSSAKPDLSLVFCPGTIL